MVVKIMLRILILTLISATAIQAGYIGCFKETSRRRIFNSNPGALEKVTPQTCSSLCGGWNFAYAVLAAGRFCFCGNSDPASLSSAADTKCSTPCADDVAYTCGSAGSRYVSIYNGISPLNGDLSADYYWQTGSQVTFFPNVETVDSSYQLSFDYGDSSGQSEFTQLGAGLLDHIYNQEGRYVVSMTATNSDGSHPGVQTAVGVHVITKPTTFDLTCPGNMATYETGFCEVVVPRGTHMLLSARYTNGHGGTLVTPSFNIPDAYEYFIGNPVKTYQQSPRVSTYGSGVILQLATQAKNTGTLVTFEYYAETTGAFQAYIYRPDCGAQEYCYASNLCLSVGACNPACSGDEYCGDTQACCSAGPVARSTGPFPQYNKVYEEAITVSTTGSNVYEVLNGPEILPGDIVAHKVLTSPVLSMIGDTVDNDYYCTGVDGTATVSSAGCISTTEKHQLKAIYATESKARIPMAFTGPEGSVDVQVNVRNREGAFASDVTKTATIHVLQGIDKCVLQVPQYVPANDLVQFTLEPFTGSSPSVLWNFGNGQTRTVAATPYDVVTYTYPNPGTFLLSANISNALSYKECSMEICVQEPISSDLDLDVSLPLEVGSTAGLQLKMTSGTDYTCSLNIIYHSTGTTVTTELNYMANPPSSMIYHDVLVAGSLTISLHCSNDISDGNLNIPTTAMERITGLRLNPPAALLGVEYNIMVAWDSGTGVSVAVTFNSVAEEMVMNEDGTYAISGTKFSQALTTHTVGVTAWNDLSTESLTQTFIIVEEMHGANIQANFVDEISSPDAGDKRVIPVDSVVSLDITADEGTGIGIVIVWGDGSPDWTYSTGTGPWVQPAMPVYHTYTDAGENELYVSIGNGYDDEVQTYDVDVMMSVENVTLDCMDGPTFYKPPATLSFAWSANGSVGWPNLVAAEIDWGEGNVDTWTDINLNNTLIHEYYDKAGDLVVNWRVWNYASNKSGSFIVHVVTPILNPNCSGGPIAAIPNQAVSIVFKSQRRPTAGLSQLTFDLQDGSAPFTRPSTTNAPFGEEIEYATYATTGVYTPTVIIDSRKETQSCSHTITVMNMVTDEFDIKGNTPIDYDVNSTCNVVFDITFTGSVHPDFAFIEFNFGDGTTTTPVSFVTTTTETYSYAVPGVYATTIRVFNDASEVIKTVESGCYAKVTFVSAIIKRQPALPIGTPPVVGFNGGDQFRSDEGLVIEVTHDGTPGWWDVTATSTDHVYHCNYTDSGNINMDIPEPGSYSITVQANNPVNINGPFSVTNIEVIQEVGAITVTSAGITSALQSKTFSISMDKYGTSMCVGIDNGQSSVIQVYGETATCNIGSVPYSPWSTRTVNFNGGYDVTGPFDVSFQYNKEADYNLVVYAWNDYSNQLKTFPFSVSSINCSAPNIDIVDKRDSSNNAKKYGRSETIKISGKTAIECSKTLENDKNWYIIEYNDITWEEGNSVSLAGVDSEHNAELSLDPHFLSYGVYKATYEVTMHTADASGGAKFGKQVSTFFKVTESPLIVQLFKTSATLKTVGSSVNVEINPAKYSSDPDVNTEVETDTFDYFEISCIDLTNNEVRQDKSVIVQPRRLEELPGGHVNIGGCFQDGPGWFILYGHESQNINTSIMTQNHKYELHVIGHKGTRQAEFTGTLKVLTADPPDIEISLMQIGITTPNSEGLLFNANNELGLRVTYVSTCPGCTCQWGFFLFDYDFIGNEFEGWRPITYLPIYIEGTSSEELTIHTAVYDHYSLEELFQVYLTCTDLAGISGETGVLLRRNPAPSGGDCIIDPAIGKSLETFHTIQCSGFTDTDGILSYSILCDDGKELGSIISGYDPSWDNLYLPSGDPDNGDVLKCYVEVVDFLGAVGTYALHDVTSEPQSFDNFKAEMSVWIEKPDSFLHVVDAVALFSWTTGFMNAISTSLVKLSNDDETVYEGNGGAVSFTATGLSNNYRSGAFTEDNPDPEKLKVYEADRNNAGIVIKSLFITIKKTTWLNVPDIVEGLHTLSVITKSQTFIFSDTVNEIIDILRDKVVTLKKKKNLISVEQAKSVLSSIVEACHNIQSATANNAQKPSLDDVSKQAGPVILFPTNLDSEYPDMLETFDDPEAQREAGMFIMNTQYQTTFSSSIASTCRSLTSDMNKLMIDIRPMSDTPFTYSSDNVELVVQKSPASSFAGIARSTSAGSVKMPTALFSSISQDEPVTYVLEGRATSGLVVKDGQESEAAARSRCIGASFLREDGTQLEIDNLPEPVEIDLERDPNKKPDNDTELPDANPQYLESRPDDLGFPHSVYVNTENAGLLIQFLNITNVTTTNQLLVLINHEVAPTVDNVTHVCMIPSKTSRAGKRCTSNDEEDPNSCFLPGEVIKNNTGKYIIMVRQLQRKELNKYRGRLFLPKKVLGKLDWEKAPFVQSYTLKTVLLSCPYTKDGSTVQKTDGSYPKPVCNSDSLKCKSNHLTSFAGGWVVAPNAIDWDFIFSNADFLKNPTLYVTQIIIILVYIISMIWARRRDRQDLTKMGLAPLLDNEPRDKYYYEIMVNTGLRRNAGTESKVHFILSGEEDETDVRTFTDKKRKIFQRGNTDGFLMAVESSLGALSYLRIWHDNSGKGKCASWYLNHIVVRDVQTDKKYYFISNKWFAVEEDDGQVDRVIPVAGKEQMTEFSYMFSERATKNLSDGHLWFSVVARPPQSRFTRCQRVSCCLCLLYMSMLANAMFYGTQTSDSTAYSFGPFALTPEQIFIGVACNIIIFPINFLIITLFRKSRPRKLRPSRVEEALKSMPERTTSMTDVNMRMKSSMSVDRPGSSFLIDAKRSESSMSRPDSSLCVDAASKKSKAKKKCTLPWWFTIVSWILLWMAVLVSMAFVTFYGIQFQDIKCKKWITSMLISFFTSVFLTQPIKVFLFAIIFSLIIKNPGGDEEEDEDEEPTRKLENDEEFLHQDDDGYGLIAPRRPMYKPKPPDQKSLDSARQLRLKEIQMWAVIREILFYAFFLWILLVISYKSVSTNSYHYKHNMEKVFVWTTNTNHSFTNVTNVGSFWTWARLGMLRGLRAGPYYNNFPPFYMRGYINDKVSRIMGYAVLRQVRVEPGSCKVPYQVENIIDECNAPFNSRVEEQKNFGPGWSNIVNQSRPEYTYTDADTLNGYPYWGEMAMYGGGGYVIRLNKDYQVTVDQFLQLEQEKWIDEYTRAVFLEFTVYNPAINMFAISTMLAEFRPSGGVFTTYRFEPATLLPYMSSVLLFQIICEIIYFLFTCWFVIKEIRAFYKQRLKYFYQFWNIIELCICAMSVTAIVIYFYRLVCINELTEYFNETNGNGYMKFQYVGYWSEIFSYIIGFLVYFACLKFLKLLRFNKRVSLLADTLKNSAKDLIHFSIIFNIVFLAFIQVFYLIYVARIDTFKTFLSSCEAGIVMMMGKFDIYNMLEVNQWLTQIFLFLFVVTITFIVVNMFLSILNDTFGAVRDNMSKQSNDYEIVEFMMSRFKLWTGVGRGAGTTISPSDLESEKKKNYSTLEGQIDYFPDQIDRFLASISNMYVEKSKFDDFLHQGAYGKMAQKAQMKAAMHPAPKPGSTRLSYGAKGMTDVQTD